MKNKSFSKQGFQGNREAYARSESFERGPNLKPERILRTLFSHFLSYRSYNTKIKTHSAVSG